MKNKKRMFIFGMLLTAMLTAVNAQAQVAVYTGSTCVVFSGTGATYNWSTIGNNSSGWLYMDCPVDNESPTNIESGWVKVLDQNDDSGGEVTCQLISVYQSGSGMYYWGSAAVSSSGYGSSWQTLSFGSVGNSAEASVYYSCKIPKNDIGVSWIGNYQVSE